MKRSRFNFIFANPEDSSSYILYNSMTQAMANVTQEYYAKIKEFIENGTAVDDDKIAEELLHGGFAISDNRDEIEEIRYDLFKARFSSTTLALGIGVTADCNFRCGYCYEKDVINTKYMDSKTQNNIVKFVENHAPSISSLVVTWYGGEPLLAFNTIVSLSERFMEICKKSNITYNADIITNGYLLTPQRVNMLSNLKVNQYQITIDGPKEIHDKRRPLIGGHPTFDKIMSNLSECRASLAGIAYIRINVDKGNTENINDVVKALEEKGLTEVVYPYLGMLFDGGGSSCADFDCYKNCEFAELDLTFTLSMKDYKTRISNSYPRRRGNFCAGDFDRSFTIGADGKMYKCYVDIGFSERVVADINDASFLNTAVRSNYVMYDPTLEIECGSCKFLPICIGGCPHSRLFKDGKRCDTLKFNLNRYMEMFPIIMAQKRHCIEKESLI